MQRRPPITRTLAEQLARRAGNQALCRVVAPGAAPAREPAPREPDALDAVLARAVARRREVRSR